MHTCKKHSRIIDEGIVAGKNNMLRTDLTLFCLDQILFHTQNRRVFINSQMPRKMRKKLQRMKLGLIGKADCPGGLKGE